MRCIYPIVHRVKEAFYLKKIKFTIGILFGKCLIVKKNVSFFAISMANC